MLSSSSSSSSSSTFWSRRRKLFFGSAIFGPLLQGLASTTQAVHYPIQPFREFSGLSFPRLKYSRNGSPLAFWAFYREKILYVCMTRQPALNSLMGYPFFPCVWKAIILFCFCRSFYPHISTVSKYLGSKMTVFVIRFLLCFYFSRSLFYLFSTIAGPWHKVEK